jgi:seryl-tRNA synthetase
MTIWEKAVFNMQRGAQRLSTTAAIISERLKAEITIARLRIRLDEVKAQINEQHRIIGRRVVNLANGVALPKTSEQLVNDEEIAAAMTRIEAHKKEMEDLHSEIANKQAEFKPVTKHEEPPL